MPVTLLDCSVYVFAVALTLAFGIFACWCAWRLIIPVPVDTLSVNGRCYDLGKQAN